MAEQANNKLQTQAVRQGIAQETQFGAVAPPIYLSTNYTFENHQQPRQFDYSRSGNPSRETLNQTLAALEGGAGAVSTATGLAAIQLILHLLSIDDLLVVPHDCYGGSLRLFTHLAEKGHFKLIVIDQTDPQAVTQMWSQQPAMIWLETPSNPLLRVVDIQQFCQQAQQQAHTCRVVVDNTFLSPVFQQPLTLGADIVVHSTTKYLNGHGDVVGGVAIAKSAEDAERLAWWSNTLGITGAPFDAYLTLRGIRTLALRMQTHEANAKAVVECLLDSDAVAQVYYPGLVNHPQHQLACQQQLGFGGMVSFELKGGQAQVAAFVEQLKLFTLAESLGGVESLIAIPATMTHRAMTEAQRLEAGLSDTLIRLSVGIEHPADLVADLKQALATLKLTQK